MENKKQEKKDLSYYLTLFKISGHQTWRTHISDHKDGFSKQIPNIKTDITDTQLYKIDRLTGEVKKIIKVEK